MSVGRTRNRALSQRSYESKTVVSADSHVAHAELSGETRLPLKETLSLLSTDFMPDFDIKIDVAPTTPTYPGPEPMKQQGWVQHQRGCG